MPRGQASPLSHSCHICPWGWTSGSRRPPSLPALHKGQLCPRTCAFPAVSASLIRNGIMRTPVSAAKDAVPVCDRASWRVSPNPHTPASLCHGTPWFRPRRVSRPTCPRRPPSGTSVRETARQRSPTSPMTWSWKSHGSHTASLLPSSQSRPGASGSSRVSGDLWGYWKTTTAQSGTPTCLQGFGGLVVKGRPLGSPL